MAWIYVKGVNAPDDLRHVNGIRYDNRWTNLTTAKVEVPRPFREAISGCYGIRWQKETRDWYAYVGFGEMERGLGSFKSKEKAVKVRQVEMRRLRLQKES